MGKEKPGNGKSLKPFRWWQGLWRSSFGINHDGARWDITVDFFDWDERIALYKDGRQDRTQVQPAKFTLDDGAVIEARTSFWGMRRAHLVTMEGNEQMLTPAPGSAERWRADLEQARPALSRTISIVSFLVLLTSVVVGLPQGIEWLAALSSQVAPNLPDNLNWAADWLDRFTFTSPWHLDGAANTVLLIAGVAAVLERALRLRYSWWLEGLDGFDGSWG